MADPNQGTFPYRPLPDGADAIRLLTVQPGDFSDRLVCELETVLFSAKPRFTALSYTWQNPYIASQPSSNRLHDGDDRPRPHAPPTPDSPMVIISQGDHEFQVEVQHNLYLALLHLRSLTHPLTLWVDAVCINQDDMEERGCQVAIMSFIFTRALQVVVWLGPKDYGSRTDKTQRMHNDWRTGPVRMLATSLASNTESRGFSNVMQLDYSAEPDPATVNRIAASAYWTRLWIVQEMCLPQRVVLVYGSVMWRYEDFAGWNILAEARRPPLAQNYHHANPLTENSGIKAIFSLTDTRNARHSEKLRLERLVERFAGSHCTEIRDRVYGLLGLASDVFTFPRDDNDGGIAADPIEEYLGQLNLDGSDFLLPEPQRGSGYLKIDYACHLYDLWAELVKFAFFRARTVELHDWCTAQFSIEVSSAKVYTTTMKWPWIDERRVSLVRTAGVVQAALDQRVDQELREDEEERAARPGMGLSWIKPSNNASRQPIGIKPIIRAYGYLAGRIDQLGPSYSSWVGSVRAYDDWRSSWEDHYERPADLELLRKIHERYANRVLDYSDKHLDRVRKLVLSGSPYSAPVVAWRHPEKGSPTGNPRTYQQRFTESSKPRSYQQDDQECLQPITDHDNNLNAPDNDEPRLFLATGHAMGLVPPTTRTGDFVVRFWNCDAAIVVRPIKRLEEVKGSRPPSSFMLLGRADVAEVVDRTATPGFDTHGERMLWYGHTATTPGLEDLGPVCVDLDLPTLQKITAHITT